MLPSVFCVGACQLIVALPVAGAVLVVVIENAGSEAVAAPSLTRMTMPLATPAAVGVPDRRPVAVLNVAQLGRLSIVQASVSPFASLALGWKEYCVPTVAVVDGVPLIVGAVFAAALTVIVKALNDALVLPSLTLITMPLVELVAVGVPLNRPVAVSNVAHAGRWSMVNPSESPSASEAVGWKLYAEPTRAVVGAGPEIVGARFGCEVTLMLNAANAAVARPSLTLITMFEYVPTFVVAGVPLKRPVVVLNAAHVGRFTMLYVNVSPSGSLPVGWKA